MKQKELMSLALLLGLGVLAYKFLGSEGLLPGEPTNGVKMGGNNVLPEVDVTRETALREIVNEVPVTQSWVHPDVQDAMKVALPEVEKIAESATAQLPFSDRYGFKF
jgi:hypothetical protein